MARQYRKKPTKIADMPGLWDVVKADPKPEDKIKDLIELHRKSQITPTRPMKSAQIELEVLRATVRPKELEFISFGSGSSGNCAYLGIRGLGGILIDAGVDSTKVLEMLDSNYISLDKINGILLTHDHSDHVRYAYQLLRKNPAMRLYCTPRTLTGMLRRHNISKRIKDYHQPIFKEFEFEAGRFKVTPFEVSHDGSDNIGYSIDIDGRTFVVATDMGHITDRADHYIRQANYLMIEANYDNDMLTRGKYPEYLKARIRGERGHLDNEVTARYLGEIWTPRLTDIYLCHLSLDNNRPEIALRTARLALLAAGATVGDGSGSSKALAADVQLSALPRYDASPVYIHRL